MIIQGIFNNLGASFGKSISLRHNITSQEIHGIFAADMSGIAGKGSDTSSSIPDALPFADRKYRRTGST